MPAPRNELEAWRQDAAEVATALGTDVEHGLTDAEAAARLARYGPNELRAKAVRPVWRLFLEQFTNAMILVLIGAAAITAAIGDLKDTVVILAIVALNGIVGFVQEYRAEEAMAALKQMTSPSATVMRDGERRTLAATEVVPGDLVLLETGDVVAADLRLVTVAALSINEAALTGESESAAKTTDALPDVGEALLADQRNLAFKGTAVTYGRGRGVVIATGMASSLGRIADLLQERGSGATPLQRRLSRLGKSLAMAAIVICVIVFVVGVARGEPVDLMFLTAVSLAVAAIPEALPAVVTVSLALGAQRMARRRALVRKLPAVETLGSVNVVCTDKTGTLTQNRMLAEHVWTRSGTWSVTGRGYAPDGRVDGPVAALSDPDLADLALIAALCNDAALIPPSRRGEPWAISGDPTEGALLALAPKLDPSLGSAGAKHPRAAEIPFDSERRRMTTLHHVGDGYLVAVKGALEALRPLAGPGDEEAWAAAEAAADTFADQGFRVLAFAGRTIGHVPVDLEEVERGIRLIGLVGLADPPRDEAAAAVAAARAAGITPVMITGDHARTAEAIARRLDILDGDRSVLTGQALAELDDAALRERVGSVAVYARTNPEQKLRIVDAWKARGAIVAMTGDGVNDAPALKRSDIGVAMGITGTEVSKEAADMVLADDDFATIVTAVEEGRRIYDNIRRFVRYTLTSNAAEIWVMFLAPFLGLPLPLLPVHILWINLVTDGLPGLALGVEPAERDTMRRPPRPDGESIFARGLWQHVIWVGLWMAAVTLVIQAVAVGEGWPWQTMVFTTLALVQLGHALAVRSERDSLFRLGLRSNMPLTFAVLATLGVQLALVYVPALQPIFSTEALTAEQLGIVLAASTLGFVAVEIEKWVGRRRTPEVDATPA